MNEIVRADILHDSWIKSLLMVQTLTIWRTIVTANDGSSVKFRYNGYEYINFRIYQISWITFHGANGDIPLKYRSYLISYIQDENIEKSDPIYLVLKAKQE